ncbi:response regulator [Haliangium sp.]|uniref:response regulator n=1 Tax=Haliangium sp. TaxID=2663208 RepID=UPI003D13DE08
MARILIADDEANIRDVVQYALERDGYEVETAADGQAALARIEAGGIDLVVLDVLMPELDGLNLCRRLREQSDVPVIFLSSRSEEADRILGLELGGDDYLTKPFSPRELSTRIKAVLRRTQARRGSAERPPALVWERLVLDPEAHELRVDDHDKVALTVTEFRLLAAILERPGRVLTRAQLIERAYDDDTHVTERTVDTHIRRIRAKLRPWGIHPIETVHGLGYKAP